MTDFDPVLADKVEKIRNYGQLKVSSYRIGLEQSFGFNSGNCINREVEIIGSSGMSKDE